MSQVAYDARVNRDGRDGVDDGNANNSNNELGNNFSSPDDSAGNPVSTRQQNLNAFPGPDKSFGPMCSLPCVASSIIRKQSRKNGLIINRKKEIVDIIKSILSNERCQDMPLSSSDEYDFDSLWNGGDFDLARCKPNVTILQGLPGTGKTTLAAIICHRPDVRSYFVSGGIAWLNLSKAYHRDENVLDSCPSDAKFPKSDSSTALSIADDTVTSRTNTVENSLRSSYKRRASGIFQSIQPLKNLSITKDENLETFQDEINLTSSSSCTSSDPESDSKCGVRQCKLKNCADAAHTLGLGKFLNYKSIVESYVLICNQLNLNIPDLFKRVLTTIDELPLEIERNEIQAKENARQIMANHLSSHGLNSSVSQKKFLIVLDDLWNPEDIEWFQFGGLYLDQEFSCQILATTRIHKAVTGASCIEIGTFSHNEGTKCFLKGLEEVEDISKNGEHATGVIVEKCGNLPAVVSSASRWVNIVRSGKDNNIRKDLEDLARLLERSNFFEHNPEWEEEQDLVRVMDESFCPSLHGQGISRVLKICLASFVVIFSRRTRRMSSQNRSGTTSLSVPVKYVEALWEKILESEIISSYERSLFDESHKRKRKRKSAFKKLSEAFLYLGILEELLEKTSDGRQIICYKVTHQIFQIYAEYLFRDSDSDPLKTSGFMSVQELEISWNNMLVSECLKESGQSDSWEMLQGCCDDHVFQMLPSYMIRCKNLDNAASYLADKGFIRGRLSSMGVLEGTKCHIADCDLLERYAYGKKGVNFENTILSSYMKIVNYFQVEVVDAEEGTKQDKNAALAMHELANSLFSKRLYNEALKMNEDCLQAKKLVFGSDSAEAADSLNNMAIIYEKRGQKENDSSLSEKALEYYKEVLRIRRTIFGSFHENVAKVIIQIGNIHFETRNFLEAINCFEEALHTRKHTLGNDHEETSDTLSLLGMTYLEVEAYQKALVCYEDALKAKQLIEGKDSQTCGEIIFQIARAHKAANEIDQAVQKFKEALRIFRLVGVKRDDSSVVESTLFINWATSNIRRNQRIRENKKIQT